MSAGALGGADTLPPDLLLLLVFVPDLSWLVLGFESVFHC
jgi:hypothetical protein